MCTILKESAVPTENLPTIGEPTTDEPADLQFIAVGDTDEIGSDPESSEPNQLSTEIVDLTIEDVKIIGTFTNLTE